MNAARVAEQLRALGVPVVSHSEADDSTDGEVVITPTVSVQVGTGYLIVGKWIEAEEAMQNYPPRLSCAGLVPDIVAAGVPLEVKP